MVIKCIKVEKLQRVKQIWQEIEPFSGFKNTKMSDDGKKIILISEIKTSLF